LYGKAYGKSVVALVALASATALTAEMKLRMLKLTLTVRDAHHNGLLRVLYVQSEVEPCCLALYVVRHPCSASGPSQ
jgi:hypothetical protein